jgi:hypothetical protein
MTTVPAPTTRRKVFRAHYYDAPGQLAKVGGSLYFFSDAGDVTEVEPDAINFLIVLGEAQLVDAQYIEDLMHGGPVGVALSREEGVS